MGEPSVQSCEVLGDLSVLLSSSQRPSLCFCDSNFFRSCLKVWIFFLFFISSGSAFQCSTTRFEKKCLNTSNFTRLIFMFTGLLFCLVFVTGLSPTRLNQVSHYTLSRLCIILYTCTKSSWSRLFLRVSSPSSSSLSLYDLPVRPC